MNWPAREASPIVWREPVDFGGLKLLIGGANEFQEYCNTYYGLDSVLHSCDMAQICKSNDGLDFYDMVIMPSVHLTSRQ